MIEISFVFGQCAVVAVWILFRIIAYIKIRNINWRFEAKQIFFLVNLLVIYRFTFHPFSKVDGQVQPLIFDPVQMWNFRINLLPLVYLMDYEVLWEMKINIIGNITMFIPIGIVWPAVFRKLDTHKKVIAAGTGFSLAIEILQLPFYDRVTDVDDLILNSLGFLIGYGIYLLVKKLRR